jgi:hypothetical protein
VKIRLRPGADLGRLRAALREGGPAEVLRLAREQGETAPSEQELQRWRSSKRRPAEKKRGDAAGRLLSECRGKKRYRDFEQAKRVKSFCEARRKEKLRVYGPCGRCGGFHLTRSMV